MPTQPRATGLMNLYGWKPGMPMNRSPELPLCEDARFLVYTYLTTPEAVAEVLPEPLEPGPRPLVAITVSDYPKCFVFSGVNHPYNEVIVFVQCQYKGEVGVTIPYIYIGAREGDFTYGADQALCAGREVNGFPKKLANISINREGDFWTATMLRRGVKLLDYKAKFDREISPSQSPIADFGRLFLTREILKPDCSGFDVHQVIAYGTGWITTPKSMLVGNGSVELGHQEEDPLDALPVVQPGDALNIVNDTAWEGIEVVDDLLRRAAV